ncbi:MAG: hypothetical protein M1540_03475 [Candidatus Bathyarchaeota archaeon]|nr:hypothetical protein [Candidatus Bathyarchaeota archaeon]
MVTAASVWVIVKKTFSLTLIFNALVTLGCVAGIIYGFYVSYPNWEPYSPYLLNGNLFWLAIAAALINIFPSAAIGRALHTGRFLFHHYVYGAFVLAGSSAYVFFFTPIPIQNLFLIDSNSIPINAVRVCLLAGLALFLDDLPDCNKRVEAGLNWMKTKAFQVRKGLHVMQILTGSLAIYCAASMILSTVFVDAQRALPNSFCIGSLLITGITSFVLAKRGAWLKIAPPTPKAAKLSV